MDGYAAMDVVVEVVAVMRDFSAGSETRVWTSFVLLSS